jgi:glycosidase
MRALPKYPSLYQINTRVWLTELSRDLDHRATLDDIPDRELDRLAEVGFDWIWLLSVWTTGQKGRKISRENSEWRGDFERTLPDLREDDIAGSGFAIADYRVHPDLGGDTALKRLRSRLKKRGLKLMLDFVPNHMGPDHPWVIDHPDYFISGTENDLLLNPQNYTKVQSGQDNLILAYGRDPYFSGWPDTLQLDYSNPAAAEAMKKELIRISGQCDGLRCDMAMLVLPEVFERTWGRRAQPFWARAIDAVRGKVPGFCFMAEVYWDMEWELQQVGFDYAYDKRLYDRLHEGNALAIREHLFAGPEFQDRLARFLENHDEPRAATTFGQEKHEAAAVITYFSPGLRFFHQGQLEGKTKRISPHLVRGPEEPTDQAIQEFYNDLLPVIKQNIFRDGRWKLLQCMPAWEGNDSWNSFIVFTWEAGEEGRALICVNYSPFRSQCYFRLPFPELAGQSVRLRDQTSSALYVRHSSEFLEKGIFIDLPDWDYHIFKIQSI